MADPMNDDLVSRLEARTVTTTESGPGGAFHYVVKPDKDCREAAALIRAMLRRGEDEA